MRNEFRNFNPQRLLGDIGRLIKGIDDEIDWFIASIQEKDQRRKTFARFMVDEKQDELVKLAKEVYERLK